MEPSLKTNKLGTNKSLGAQLNSRFYYNINIQNKPGLKPKLSKIFMYSLLQKNIKSVNGKKTTIRLISKKETLHLQHTFFCKFIFRCFARLQRETSRNCHTFYGGNVVRFFFSLPLISTLVPMFSPPLRYFHVVLVTKFLFSLQHSSALFLVELRWPVAYFLFLCLFLCLYSKFMDMTSSLNTLDNIDTEKFPLSFFVIIDCLVELFYIGMPVRSRDYQIFSDRQITTFSQVWAALARQARAWNSAMITITLIFQYNFNYYHHYYYSYYFLLFEPASICLGYLRAKLSL